MICEQQAHNPGCLTVYITILGTFRFVVARICSLLHTPAPVGCCVCVSVNASVNRCRISAQKWFTISLHVTGPADYLSSRSSACVLFSGFLPSQCLGTNPPALFQPRNRLGLACTPYQASESFCVDQLPSTSGVCVQLSVLSSRWVPPSPKSQIPNAASINVTACALVQQDIV